MTGDPSDEGTEDEPTPPAQQAGVLGNLPKTRPQVRSPRRKSRSEAKARKQGPPQSTGSAANRPPQPKRTHDPSTPPKQPESTEGPPDLEAIARGGLQIAGEAASLGLRIAGRAATAIRDSVERR
jgi:hypothetical protein